MKNLINLDNELIISHIDAEYKQGCTLTNINAFRGLIASTPCMEKAYRVVIDMLDKGITQWEAFRYVLGVMTNERN